MVRTPRVVCCDRCSLEPLGAHGKILSVEPEGCRHKHVMRQLFPYPDIPGNYPCAGFQACQINELVSLHERHVKEVPVWTNTAERLWAEAFDGLREKYRPKSVNRLSRAAAIAQAPSTRRVRMAKAYANIDKYGWTDKYARVKTFIKWEKFDDTTMDLQDKAARLIQHRSDEYCYTLARFLKPIEKAVLYKSSRGDRSFAKGMTPRQKGAMLAKYAGEFSQPCFVLLDHSRYDAHLVDPIRESARRYFRDFYPGDGRLAHLLNLQRQNLCRTSQGVRYTMRGTMCSGDYNTSLEDNVINYAIISRAFDSVRARYLIDGDDSVVILEASDLPQVDLGIFAQACLATKVDVVYDLAEADFCQMKTIHTITGPMMVRDPFRVMSRSSYTVKTYPDERTYTRLGRAIAMCEMSCNRGVPVLQAYAEMLLRSTEGVFAIQAELEEMLRHRRVALSMQPLPIPRRTRVDFWLAYGISPETQVQYECWFSTLKLPVIAMEVGSIVEGR